MGEPYGWCRSSHCTGSRSILPRPFATRLSTGSRSLALPSHRSIRSADSGISANIDGVTNTGRVTSIGRFTGSDGGQGVADVTRIRPRRVRVAAAATESPEKAVARGHSALVHGLGDVGLVPPQMMPTVLRIAHVVDKGHRGAEVEEIEKKTAFGILGWKVALERGLVPDDKTLEHLQRVEKLEFLQGRDLDDPSLRWPMEPLRTVLLREVSVLGISALAAKYPVIQETLLKGILATVFEFAKFAYKVEDEVEERERDEDGNVYESTEEVGQRQEEAQSKYRNPNMTPEQVEVARKKKLAEMKHKRDMESIGNGEEEEEEGWQSMAPDERKAVELVRRLVHGWQKPIDAIRKAGKAFSGFEDLLASGSFALDGAIWSRKGWEKMDELREKLEDIKELRDLVRSLGRGGGWGPLRRAPVQHLDMNARMGLLRTTLEAQETRGLTRSDDISRLLPSESATLARGMTVPMSKLIFYSKLVEKSLQTYERDGWGEFPTQIDIDRREIRPTADRGPILLCCDTSGSMRGPRELVAKALTLECMRAAKIQERGCYVFAFAGPREVRELELNMDPKSIENLLDFLEKTFNGGSNFNAPVQMCLDRLTQAQWANSDILLVSDGELRQPQHEVMRKLSGAKEKLGLRVHGLVLGSPEEKRADPAVLRSLCTQVVPNTGKVETLMHEFDSWASVKADTGLAFDWDDAAGNASRREAGLKLEKLRNAEMKRRRQAKSKKAMSLGKKSVAGNVAYRMPTKNTQSFE
jgi:uncharacterized protein with von Willebrand factor type A (vWA) domain